MSLDEINAERGFLGGASIPIEEWERTHQLALKRLQSLMQHREDVVLDDTNNLRALRDRFRHAADSQGYVTRLLYLAPGVTVLRARAEGVEGNRTLSVFEPPGPDEFPLVLDEEREPDEQAAEIAPSK